MGWVRLEFKMCWTDERGEQKILLIKFNYLTQSQEFPTDDKLAKKILYVLENTSGKNQFIYDFFSRSEGNL